MGDVIELRKGTTKPPDIPEKCFLRFSTPDKDGCGPVYCEWYGVSPQMLIVVEEVTRQLKDVLFELIQEGEEDENDEEA
jgi:hypothetical protein